jgi:inner membrane protein
MDTAHGLDLHRAAGHSLVVMGLGTYGLARGAAKLWVREKISARDAGIWIGVTWLAHMLVDACTVEGVALAWPLSGLRMSFHLLGDSDLLFAAPMVVSVVWLAFLPPAPVKKPRGKKALPPSRRGKICRWGLGLSAGYLLLAGGLKGWISAGFEADLVRRGIRFERRMESPMPANLLLWRGVVDQGNEFRVGYRSVFEGMAAPVRWTMYPKGAEALESVRELRETRTLQTLTGGWWLARPHGKGAWLGDLRHAEDRTWGSRKTMVDSRMAVSWLILPEGTNDHLRTILPDPENDGELMGRMSRRIVGQRDRWEANPRLAGVPGSLPEFLAVEE